jgi:Matrixin
LRSKSIAFVAAVLLLAPTASSAGSQRAADVYAEPKIGAIYGVGAAGPGSYAVLIDVHEIEAGGRSKAKPQGGANCTNAGAESGTYLFTGWKVGGNTVAHLNTATVPSSLGNVTTALQSSFNVWRTDAAVPSFNVATDGTVTRYTANQRYEIMWGRTGGSLATTYTWRWNDGTIESDVVFDTGHTWWQAPSEGDGCYEDAGNRYDVANIATHEFGHVYGLDHPSGARFETMYAYGFSGETLKRSPASGDRNGVSTLY